MQEHHGHRFNQIERLRSPERLERLEVERVVDLTLEGELLRSVLDIGTGTGIFAEAFTQHGLSVTGIDVNPEMLDAARTFLPGGDFRQAAAEYLPFPDESFDLSFLGLVLHETDDLLKALQETYRVSKKQAVVLEWPYEQQDFGPGIEERLRPEYMETLSKQAGFERIEMIPLKALVLYRLEKGGSNGKL
jgi:ubiquinone/menaquinone biosynthesis C-methylase UbiE